jgi:multiple antibiotic resistance protein
MGPLSHVELFPILIIFFLTLGPLKAIAPFVELTRGTDPEFRRTLAWRGTAIATVIVLAVALLGAFILENWRVSIAAVVITGSIILFLQALHLILQPPTAPAPVVQPGAGQTPEALALAPFSLAVPILVTAPGVAAIAAFIAIAGGDWAQRGLIIAALLVIMALNLITLLNVETLLKHIPPPFLKVLGWVLAVLQAALAVQYVINGLIRLGALPLPIP